MKTEPPAASTAWRSSASCGSGELLSTTTRMSLRPESQRHQRTVGETVLTISRRRSGEILEAAAVPMALMSPVRR